MLWELLARRRLFKRNNEAAIIQAIAEARQFDLLGPDTLGEHTTLLEHYQQPLEMPSTPVFGHGRDVPEDEPS